MPVLQPEDAPPIEEVAGLTEDAAIVVVKGIEKCLFFYYYFDTPLRIDV